MIWLTSDLHLGHEKVAHWRGFSSALDHDRHILEQWSKRVQDRDTVWVLGDVALGPDKDLRLAQLSSVPGIKHLVLGNHDRAHPCNRNAHAHQGQFRLAFESVSLAATINHDGAQYFLSHFPYDGDSRPDDRYRDWRLRDEGGIILHGHTHSPERVTYSRSGTRQHHVGLDAWGLAPASLTEVLNAA